MEDFHYFKNPAPDEQVLRFDVIVPNVWDYLMDPYATKIVDYQNRIGGFAKESKISSVEENFAPHKVYWRTQHQYWEEYNNENAWR